MFEYLIEFADCHLYIKNNKGPNTDLWGTLQFMIPVPKKTVPNETKKFYLRMELFYYFIWKTYALHFF